jgi:uncharacterized protein involved in exopolysaccharide biosynthesis
LQQNRTFEQSPELTFTHDRLQREVSVQQQLYLSLAQAYEQARIDEVRNTPIITMIERPIMPVANPRMLFVKVGMALLAGVALACLVAFLREVFSADRRGAAEELQELEELKGAAWGDVERISSRLRHPFGVRSSG